MLNRRHIRVKILQLLYSKSTADSKPSELISEYNKRSKNFFRLFISKFLLFEKLYQEFLKKEKIISKRNFENDSSSLKNIVLNNELLIHFKNSLTLQKIKKKYEIDIWDNNIQLIEILFNEIFNSDLFNDYKNLKALDFDKRKKFVVDVFKKIIVNNDLIYQLYEDSELEWIDDFPLVNTLFLNYLKAFNINKKNSIPIKIFNDKDDKKFGSELFKTTLKNDKNLDKIISKFTPDWENERIAVVDFIILKMCINEFLNFPSVPVKVSINEYVEISKNYSSPESSNFINGVANNIFKYLTENNQIKKNERGLQ
jgi:N utilization substance protein B